jgi:hypothetical protein
MSGRRFAETLRELAYVALLCSPVLAAQAGAAVPPEIPATHASAERNGEHDFDFDLGTWRTRSSRLLHPLSGSTDWVEMDGTTVVSKIWGGRANLAEFKGSPQERGHYVR